MANTAKEMIIAVGTLIAVRCGDLEVNCRVLDVKNAYGQNRLQVTPVKGAGKQWVEMSRISRIDDGGGLVAVEAVS